MVTDFKKLIEQDNYKNLTLPKGSDEWSIEEINFARGYMKGSKLSNELLLKALEALESIANEDYRGNRSSESIRAFKTLNEIRAALELGAK